MPAGSDFKADLAQCQQVTLGEWQRRAMGERILATLGVLLERQQ